MAGFGVNVDLKVITTKEQLIDQVKKQIGDAIDIGAKLVVDPGSIETLSKSLQEALDKKQFKVNIGNVKLLDSARNEMKKQIESMFGYSTKETTLETKELQKQVELLQKKAAAYEANAKKAESELQKQRESLKTTQEKTIALKNQKDALSEMYNTTKKLVEKSGSNDLKNELTMYKQLMNELNVKKEVLSDDQLNSRIEGMRQLATEARNVISAQEEKARSDREAAAASKEAERSEETRTALLGQLEYQYHKLVASMERFQHTGMTDVDTIDDEEVKATVEQYENLKQIFEQALQSSDEFSNEAIQDLYKQASAIEKVTGAIRSEAAEQKRQNELLRQADTLYQNMYQFVQSNTAASARGAAINGGHDTGAAVQSLMNDLQVRKDNGTLTPQDLTEIRRQYDLLVNSAKTLNIVGRESDSVFKQLFSRFSFVSLIVTGFHKAIAVCREMVENVKNLDAAMTELRKVTTETEAGYAKFFETAGERAKELGATVVDVISATADFARLGYSLDDASVLADVATIYKNVGDGITSIDVAAESIISTMKAFGIEAQDAINIVDKFNETGNNFAISSKGVGDALIRSASALAAANNDLDESIALVTAMNSTVQNPEKVGNALKTLAAYLRSSKVDLEELGETGEMIAETTPKLQEKMTALTHGAVQILERDGKTIRSTYAIMKDLSKIWDTGFLSDVDQAAILEMIAGKRQSSTVASLLQNFETAEEVMNRIAGNNAMGSALEENSKYLESINGKIAQFDAAFEKLSADIMGSDLVKGYYEFWTGIVNGIDAVVSAANGLTGIIPTLSTVAGLFIGGTTNSNPVTWIRSLHTMFAGSGELIANIRDSEPIIQDYNTLLKDGAEEAIKYADSLADAYGDEGLTKYLQGLKGGIATTDGYIASLKEAGVSTAALTVRTVALRAAQMALNAAITAFISFAISFVISKISKAIEDYNNRLDIAVEKTEKLNAEWEEFEKTNAANTKTVKAMADEFETLAKGVDENGKNISLTSDEYERYLQLVDTLIGIAPTLVQGYNDENEAIINKNDAIQKTIDLLEEEYELGLRNRVAPSNMATQLGGYTAGYRQAEIARNEARTAYGQAAAMFLTNGSGAIPYETALALLKKFNISDMSAANYMTKSGGGTGMGVQLDVAAFAADLMDRVMKQIDNIDPKSLGYNDIYEMQRAYENIVAAQSEVAAKQKEMSDMLRTSSEALYDVARTYDGWDKLSQTTQDAIFSLIDSYTSDISTIAEQKSNGDWVVTEEKVTQAEAHIDRMIAKLIDDGVQKAVETINELTEQYQAGQVSEEDYKYQSSNILRDLVDKNTPKQIVLSLKAVVDDAMLEKELKEAADNLSEKAQAIFDSLNPDENGFAAAFDFSEAITNLDTLGKSFSDLADAILQVRDGTMLTEQEITSLIAKYPELVEAGNLYAADTIEGQQAILEHFMQTKEAEYDAEIQTNVARLTAQQSLLEQQVAVEDAKLAAIANMREQMNEASLKNSQAYQEALDEINEIGAENFATIKDGEVVYNADALSRMLENDTEYANKSITEAWEPHSEDIATDTDAAYDAVTQMLEEMLAEETRAFDAFRVGTLIPLANDTAAALIGEMPAGGYSSGYKSRGVTKIAPRHQGSSATNAGEIAPGVSVLPETKLDKSLYDAVNAKVNIYLDASERIAQQNKQIYQSEIESIKNQISTLNSLKGLDLPTVYGKAPTASKSSTPKSSKSKSGSSAKEKTVEEYKADIDAYYAAEKKLAEAQFKRAQLERQLDDTTDLKEKIEIERQLIDVYKEESDAQAELLRLKEETIGQNVRALQQLGFEVEYNEATNQLYISNMEHLNELVADSKGDYETIEEATNELRKTTEALIDNTEKLAGECGTASDAMYDLAKGAEAAKARIIEYLDEMVSKANEVVDGFQGIYDTFTQAAREFSSTGYLSIDSLQAILQLGPKYLQLLYDEAGQLQVSKERIQDIIAARSREMAVQTAYSHVMQIIEALNDDDDDALRELVKVTKEFTDETWGSVYALAAQADTLAKLKGKSDMFEFSVTDQVRQIESMYQTMISSMDEYNKSLEDGYVTQKDALQDIIDMTIDYIKWENEQKSDALEKEKDDYKDIIDSRKEALRLAKEEDKRNADTEDKLREIAKLQRKIDQLSLDDSREARAQRASLEEQLYQLQRDIQEQQSEDSISAAEDALDAQYEAFSDEKDKEIDALQKETQSYQKLWDKAIASLENDWQGMYQKILDFNHEYGNDLDKNVITKWEQAIKAVERYGSVTDALNGTASDSNIGNSSTPEYAKWEQTMMENARIAAASMKANSIAWLTADPKTERPALVAKNEQLGYAAGMTKVNGAWYMPNGERAYKLTEAEYTQPLLARIAVDVAKLAMVQDENERKRIQDEIEYFKKTLADMKAMEKFHTGGFVGDYKSLKQNEVMAVLQKGEAVLDKQKENALYKLVDFAALLQKKLGTSIDTGLLGMLTRAATPSMPTATAYAANAAGGMNFAPTITVEINHSGSLSEADARRYGDIAADAALDKLSDAFGRRGITSFGGALLKGAQA